MFTYETQVRLQDTDAAGVVYFADQFDYAHAAYEVFLEEEGVGLGSLLDHDYLQIPIVHAEADYHQPLRLGERIRIELEFADIEETKFSSNFRIVKIASEEVAAVLQTVHVAVDRDTGDRLKLPPQLHEALMDN